MARCVCAFLVIMNTTVINIQLQVAENTHVYVKGIPRSDSDRSLFLPAPQSLLIFFIINPLLLGIIKQYLKLYFCLLLNPATVRMKWVYLWFWAVLQERGQPPFSPAMVPCWAQSRKSTKEHKEILWRHHHFHSPELFMGENEEVLSVLTFEKIT